MDASARAGSRVLRAATSREAPDELLREVGDEVRGYARRFLGLVDVEGEWVPGRLSDLFASA